jgi:DNA-binding transcriptional LysR family regulator
MDTLVNVRTFLAAARLGSFAAAARLQSVAPSVVSKRIGQLEHEFGIPLFHRSTRELRLTVEGSRLLPRCRQLLEEYDKLKVGREPDDIQGHLRVDAPGTVTSRVLGPIFCEFLARHPRVDMDLRLIDRLDSSFERGCDLVIGTRPSTIDQIKDFPLMPYPCAAYASRTYVERHGAPGEPRDLVHHSCLASLLYGTIWHFYGDEGDVAVNVSPRITVNDAVILREAVIQDLGIAVLPNPLVKEDVEEGRIVLLLAGWRPPPLWLKAHIPAQRMAKPSVLALLDFLRERLAKGPPQIGET